MTEVNRYASGELSSTHLIQDAMEQAHAVPRGEGKALDWKADHESWTAGRERVRNEPGKAMETVATYAVGLLGLASAGKGAIKALPDLLTKNPVTTVREFVGTTVSTARAYAVGVGTAEGATLAAGALGVAAAVGVVERGCTHAEDLRHLSDLDAMDVGTTALLDLDPAFKQHDMSKHPGIMPERFVNFMMTSDYGRTAMPELQASADAGSRDALDALRVGKDNYLKMHPDRETRMQSDIAYSKGFDSVMWAASLPDGEPRLKDIRTHLDERDARANHVQANHG